MRWIQKQSEPVELTEWRSRNNTDINFGYDLMRQDQTVTRAVTDALLVEQGWICAYTGLRIRGYSDESGILCCECHIEHVKPQSHCTSLETVTYTNIVACYPGPNVSTKIPYGAHRKRNWPDASEQHLFVSPLESSCERRFLFDLQGNIKTVDGDCAAYLTVEKLGLNHDLLIKLRKGAIRGTLGQKNDLRLKDARTRLKKLQQQKSGQLEEFCFVLVQALEKHIKRLEAIAKNKKPKQASGSKKISTRSKPSKAKKKPKK